MERQVFSNVWDAIEDDAASAANMTMRSDLLIALRATVMGWKLPEADAARRLGVTLPRLDDVLHGRLASFSLDALIGFAQRAGLTVRLEIVEAA